MAPILPAAGVDHHPPQMRTSDRVLSVVVGSGGHPIPGALTSTLRFLYPHGSEPRLARYRSGADQQWLALPRPSTPRILVPLAPRRATGHAVRRMSSALSREDQALRRVVARLLGTGLGHAAPVRVVVDDAGPDSFVDYLRERLGERVSIAVSVGRARANRKPVLAVFGEGGEPIAFVKIGFPLAAAPHVARESAALRLLSTITFEHIETPRVLFAEEWHGAPVLAMSVLGVPLPGLTTDSPLPREAMAEFTAHFAQEPCALGELSSWQRLLTTAPLDDHHRLAALANRLDRRYGDREVLPSAWHGDWTPWNMSWQERRLQLWDWERFEEGVPAGLDAIHCAFSARRVAEPGASAADAFAWAGRVSGAPGWLSGVYLVYMATRHLSATPEVRDRAQRAAAPLLDLLDQHLAQESHR